MIVKMTPPMKMKIVMNIVTKDGPLDDDHQTDRMDSTKEWCDEEEPDSVPDEEQINKLIQSTLEFLISHDEKETLDLFKEFKDDVDEDFINDVYKLEELRDKYLDKYSHHKIETVHTENVIE